MKPNRMVMVAAVLALSLAPLATARAQGTAPANIARLERARDRNPRSAAALRSLGVAYYRAGRFADARATLEKARELSRNDGTVALYLGMSAERAGDLEAARTAYNQYLTTGSARRVKRQVRARLAVLRRQELQESARAAVAREATLSSQPADPATVAVLPLGFSGSADSSLAPLGRGFADLLVTDLSRSPRLTVLERDRLQTLVDEIARGASGTVDASTAVRSGRLLRAGRVVQGALLQRPDRRLQVDAAVVDVTSTQAVRAVSHDDELEQLFALEKQVAFDLFDALGVTLTPAERVLVEQRPTRSLAAFLAYSAGLMAEDNGNLDDADRHYSQAVRLDPSFRKAQERKEQVEAARAGETVSTATIEATLAGTAEGIVVSAADRGTVAPEHPGEGVGGTLDQVVNDLNPSPIGDATGSDTPPSPRDPASTASGTDNPAAGTGRVRVVIPQPAQRRSP